MPFGSKTSSGAAEVFSVLRSGVNVKAVDAQTRKPFRFFLYGDPALISELRNLFLAGHGSQYIPLDAAATLETLDPRRPVMPGNDARCIIALVRAGDRSDARLDVLAEMKLPVFALVVDPDATPSAPANAPKASEIGEYVVPRIDRDTLRPRVLPHIVDSCRGVEVSVGRRLPVFREPVAVKLTRDAANNALKVSAASAVVDHVPVLGLVLGAVTSAGDMIAITGIQMMLMMQIGATYGNDPDVRRIWELLPVVGGGFGWRMLSRELSGFIPVAGVVIKGAIAYAGTVVVGEGVTFYHEHGRHMSASQAAKIYEETKTSALAFAREVFGRLRRKRPE